jgi:hypothetical protein
MGRDGTLTRKFQHATGAQVEKLPRLYGVHEGFMRCKRILLAGISRSVHLGYR